MFVKKWKAFAVLLSALAVMTGGVFLPAVAARWTDAHQQSRTEDARVEQVQLAAGTQMPWNEQVAIVAGGNRLAALENGERYSREEAEGKALALADELLQNMGEFFSFDLSTAYGTEAGCTLCVAEGDPLTSLVAWAIQLADEEGNVLNLIFAEQVEPQLIAINYFPSAGQLHEDTWGELTHAYAFALAKMNGLDVSDVVQQAYAEGKLLESSKKKKK